MSGVPIRQLERRHGDSERRRSSPQVSIEFSDSLRSILKFGGKEVGHQRLKPF